MVHYSEQHEQTLVKDFEPKYLEMLEHIARHGSHKRTRNAETYSVFGMNLALDMSDGEHFPILQGRKMFPKGAVGELAAMLRGPKSIKDFEEWGCNYWKQWANPDGSINVDYGNAWLNWNGVNQIEQLIKTLKEDPNDRRMIVSGWRPDKLPEQSLPCCHMLYQWYVTNGFLDMVWYQRSVDMMVGFPSDVIVAAVWNIMLANEVGLQPGVINFMLGDCHIYKEHGEAFQQYSRQVKDHLHSIKTNTPTYDLNVLEGKPLLEFEPKDININFNPGPKIDLEVIS
jgi:thymidylate synthase